MTLEEFYIKADDRIQTALIISDQQARSEMYTEIMNEARQYGNTVVEAVEATMKQRAEEFKESELQEVPESSNKYLVLSEIEAANVKWLWYPYIPSGKITLMTADPGTGKTFLSLYITATVSDGRPFYGQEVFETRTPQFAVYQTAEDGIADTIVPRLKMIQPPPDFHKIAVFDEEKKALDFKNGINDIEGIMKDLHPALLIFDLLQAYLGADVDMHRANEVRPVLAGIGRLAEQYECAVLLIMHHSKMKQNDPLHRALGSIDIVGIARSMLILGKNPDDPKQVVMCHEKSSLAARGKSVLFHIDPSSGGVAFDGFSDLRASDILNAQNGTRGKPSIKRDEAADMLYELLGEEGWTTLDKVRTLQLAAGFSERTLYNAKKDLQLESISIGYSGNKVTYWVDNSIVDKAAFMEERRKEYIDNFINEPD